MVFSCSRPRSGRFFLAYSCDVEPKSNFMKTEQATALIAQALLREVADLQPKALAELLTIPVIQVHNVMNRLNKDGLIEISEDEKGKTYTVKDPEGLKALAGMQTDASGGAEPEKKAEAPVKKQVFPARTGRHTGKYIYKKQQYSKSACALKAVTDYVQKEKPSLKQLIAVFPDDIVSRFGVVAELKTALDLSKDRARYHLRQHQVLTTTDGKKVVVTNQWTVDRFARFCQAAMMVGIKIDSDKSNSMR